MDSFVEAWSVICDYCKNHITDVAYKTWISRIEPVNIDFDSGKATLVVPNDFHRQTLIRCYMSLLQDSFEGIFGKGIEINLVVPNETDDNSFIEKQSASLFVEQSLTFDNYVVGPSNKFAHAAALAVASNPAGAYNPLFIYGNSGLGKTHILYAVLNDIKKNIPSLSVLYTKGDDFMNEMIESIRRSTTNKFRQKYRKTDVLLVDDIQFIAGKDSTQQEFFHTFNTLYEAKKQIILTSDRPPKEIRTLEDRLRTRFESGLIADIQSPDYETRIAIIKRKAELLEIDLNSEILEYIATNLTSNIRQLEGVVKKLKANLHLKGEKPSIKNTKVAISDILNNDQPPPLTVEKIIDEVSRTFGVDPEDLRSSKRSSNISKSRQISMYIIREITQLSMTQIGEELGGKNHSTVIYAINHVEDWIKKDSSIKSIIEDIIRNIRNL